jgi:hypothetical protein
MPFSCIFIGCGLSSNYYDSEDLINTALCNLNGEICYKTGDLAWFDTTNGQLEFRGYRDHQLKLRRQSIDLEQVRSVLMEMVTNCAVIKAKHINIYYIVAYVQTTHTIQDLRQHCLARLPSYLVPCIFMKFDLLPTNLPSPDFTFLFKLSNAEKLPRTEMEQRVCKIWYQALPHIDSIPSISTLFFSLGDDPGSFLRLFHLYSTNFKHNLSIITFLKQPTIDAHARLLLENTSVSISSAERLQSVSVIKGE